MAVHLIAHIESDVLGYPGVEIALRNADQVRAGCHRQRQHNIHDQLIEISADQALVDDLTGEDRGHQRHDRGEDNT